MSYQLQGAFLNLHRVGPPLVPTRRKALLHGPLRGFKGLGLSIRVLRGRGERLRRIAHGLGTLEGLRCHVLRPCRLQLRAYSRPTRQRVGELDFDQATY